MRQHLRPFAGRSSDQWHSGGAWRGYVAPDPGPGAQVDQFTNVVMLLGGNEMENAFALTATAASRSNVAPAVVR